MCNIPPYFGSRIAEITHFTSPIQTSAAIQDSSTVAIGISTTGRTDETIEMLNILMNGRTADFGTLFQNNLDNISCWFRWIVASKENTSASYVAERKDYIEMLTAAIVTKYREGALG